MKEIGTDNDCAQEELKAPIALGAVGSLFGEMYKSSDFSKSSDSILRCSPTLKRPLFLQMLTHCYGGEKLGATDIQNLQSLLVNSCACTLSAFFSSAGIFVNKKKAALGLDQVGRLVFLANITN